MLAPSPTSPSFPSSGGIHEEGPIASPRAFSGMTPGAQVVICSLMDLCKLPCLPISLPQSPASAFQNHLLSKTLALTHSLRICFWGKHTKALYPKTVWEYRIRRLAMWPYTGLHIQQAFNKFSAVLITELSLSRCSYRSNYPG